MGNLFRSRGAPEIINLTFYELYDKIFIYNLVIICTSLNVGDQHNENIRYGK